LLIDSCGVMECCTTSSSHRNKTKGHRSVERGLKSAPHPEEDVGKEVRPSTPFFCSLQTLPPFLISLPSFAPSPLHRLPGSTKAAAQPPLLGRRHTEAARGRRLLPRGGKGNGLRRPQDPLGVSVARAPPRPPPPTAAPPPRGPSSPPPLGRRPPPREGRTRALRDPRRRQAGAPACEREQQQQQQRRRGGQKKREQLRLNFERGSLGRPREHARRSRRRSPPGRGGLGYFGFLFFSSSLPAKDSRGGARGERRVSGCPVDEDPAPATWFLNAPLSRVSPSLSRPLESP